MQKLVGWKCPSILGVKNKLGERAPTPRKRKEKKKHDAKNETGWKLPQHQRKNGVKNEGANAP